MSRKEDKLLRKIEKEREKNQDREKLKKFKFSIKGLFVKDTATMILLVSIIIVAYLVLNLFLQNKQLAQIDLTKGKIHTITDRSKEIAKTVNNDITFYLWGINDNDAVPDIIRQYNKENDKIKMKYVTDEDLELIEQYGFEKDYPAIIVTSSNGKTNFVNVNDFYSYDNDFSQVDLTEQKLTNTLYNINSDKKYKVYFLEGKTAYSIEDSVNGLSSYLLAENYEVDVINVKANPAIPEDCDILVIMGLSEDLSATEAENICQFIEKGGDVVITNDVDPYNANKDLTNFNRVLGEYGLSMHNYMVQENDPNKLVSDSLEGLAFQGTPSSSHEITRLLAERKTYPILLGVGALEIDYNTWADKMVDSAVPLITTSSQATIHNLDAGTTNNENSMYTVAAAAEKTAENGQKSRAVVIATTASFSDSQFFNYDFSFVAYEPNNSFIMNSFAYVSNQGELYSIRKTSSISRFTVTQKQDMIVRMIIVVIPAAIVVIGTVVFVKRRRLK